MKSFLLSFLLLAVSHTANAEKLKTVVANLSGSFSEKIDAASTKNFQIRNIGPTSATAEITVLMEGKDNVLASKTFCVLDLSGVDMPDIFLSECKELSDIGSSTESDPLDISVTLATEAPATGINVSLTNGTKDKISGSVSVKIMRVKPMLLRTYLSNL